MRLPPVVPDPLQAVGELCFRIQNARTLTSLREVLRSAAETFRCSFFVFGMRSGTAVRPPVQLVLSNYPKPWQRYYDASGAHAFDPVVLNALQFKGPFCWDGLHKTPQQLALREASIRNGMTVGFTTSHLGAGASAALLSFCGDRPQPAFPEEWPRIAAALSLLVASAHDTVASIVLERAPVDGPGRTPLTEVEVKCLELTARAKTAEQVGHLLGKRPRTVRYYLDRAAQKLGVATRKEAVATAIAQGIIDTRKFPPAQFSGDTELHG